ncbi:hypothetical protein ACHAPJ_006151 [Fusarium lateritium]
MSYPTQQLQPFTLYLTLSVPEEPPHTISHHYDRDMSTLQVLGSKDQNGPGTHVIGSANFAWGIYWHRELGNGTWYSFRFNHPAFYQGPPGFYKPWTYEHVEMKQSPRLYHHVVGLIRVVHVPDDIGPDISGYLNWLAPRVATKATRDDNWAMAICLRVRQRVAKDRGVVDKGAEDFDSTGLICQSLQFAYREV